MATAADHAEQFCGIVDADDLVAWMGLDDSCTADEAQAALKKKRSFYQSMQSNPKHKDAARFFIKNYRHLQTALTEPRAHMAAMRRSRCKDLLPGLRVAMEAVIRPRLPLPSQTEARLRQKARDIGVDDESYEELLAEVCEALMVPMPERSTLPPPPPRIRGIDNSLGSLSFSNLSSIPTRTPPKPKPLPQNTGWWSPQFSTLLLDRIPAGATRMLDMAAGPGWAAITLLPERPELEYLGLCADEARQQHAQQSVSGTAIAHRAVFLVERPTALPIPDGSLDVVLCVRAMQRFSSSEPLFAEALRVLRPGGRMIAVESDRFGQRFWFDESLPAVDDAFQELCVRVDTALAARSRKASRIGMPSLSMGPQLARRMDHAGFRVHGTVMYPVQRVRHEPVDAFVSYLQKLATSVAGAARLPRGTPELSATQRVLTKLPHLAPRQIGQSVHVLPLFMTTAIKPE